jgi:hypothetical protein
MSFFKEADELTDEEEAEYNKVRFQNHLDALLEAYALTGDRAKLAAFVSDGGDIDKLDVRDDIANMIIAAPEKNPGGSTDHINLAFYLTAKGKMNKLYPPVVPIDEDAKDRTLAEKLISLETKGKTEVIEQLAVECGVSISGGWSRYKKGKALFVERFGRTWN